MKWQEDAEILFRLDQVATLMLEGAKPYQIAQSMGYSWDTARRDMERVNLLWRERVGGSIEGKRAEAVAQYQHIVMHAWAQFRKVAAKHDPGIGREKAAWLKMAMDAQKEIDAILGTHAPKEITVGIHLSEAAIGALDVLERQGVQREALYAEFESFIIEEAARLAEEKR